MDVLIAGASFAGMLYADWLNKELKGNYEVAIADRKEKIGDGQTSACATPVRLIKELGMEDTIMEKYKTTVFVFPEKKVFLDYKENYACFDYKKFCEKIRERIQFKEIMGKPVDVMKEKSSAKMLVDATGWASPVVKNKKMAFGIEYEVKADITKIRDHEGCFYFYFEKDAPEGYYWLYPTGDKNARVGIITTKKVNYKEMLDRFVKREFKSGVKIENTHGNYEPYGGCTNPCLDNIFCVGDSACHITPVVYEGIRTSNFFAKKLAKLTKEVLEDKITVKEASELYSGINKKMKFYYNVMDYINRKGLIHSSKNLPVSIMKFFQNIYAERIFQ